MSRVALATASTMTDLFDDGPLMIPALAAVGIDAEPVSWGGDTDWSAYDAVILRATFDYPYRRDEFLAWIDHVAAVTRLANPAEIVRWNTDKRYLADLEAAGIPIVPTRWFDERNPTPEIPDEWDDIVVKPAVSVAGMLSGRYDRSRLDEAEAHIANLVGRGRGALVQPYVDSVDREAETGTFVFGGEVSHAISKSPILPPGVKPVEDNALAVDQVVGPRALTSAMTEFAAKVLSAVPISADLLYARVDTLVGDDGEPWLIELEATEPFFFLQHSDGGAERFAAAVVDWLV